MVVNDICSYCFITDSDYLCSLGSVGVDFDLSKARNETRKDTANSKGPLTTRQDSSRQSAGFHQRLGHQASHQKDPRNVIRSEIQSNHLPVRSRLRL
jgi:hypothetical protein